MNKYEMTVLYHPDLEMDIEKPLKKIAKLLSDNDGKIIKQDNWGKRKLAYSINKQDHAVYVYYDIELKSESVAKVESILNITDEVLRYLIVKPGPEIEEVEEKAEDSSNTDSSEESKPKEDETKK